MDKKKKLQTLKLKWLEQRFPNFFERSPNLRLVSMPLTTTQSLNNVLKNNYCRPIGHFGSKLLSLFSMSAFHSFLSKCLCYSQRQAMVTLKIHNSGLDHLGMAHFLTLRHCYFVFDPYFGNYWARSTSRPLC